METELTYENMKKLVDDYFKSFLDVIDQDSDTGKDTINHYFSKNIATRRRDWPSVATGDDWASCLVDNYPNHRYDIFIDPPYGYTVIDPQTGMVGVQMREDVFDTLLGRNVRAIMNNTLFRCTIEDGRVVFDRELIARFPTYFQIDELGIENPRYAESWMFRDYDKEQKPSLY